METRQILRGHEDSRIWELNWSDLFSIQSCYEYIVPSRWQMLSQEYKLIIQKALNNFMLFFTEAFLIKLILHVHIRNAYWY